MIQTKMNVIACVMLLMFAAVIQCRNMDVDTNDIDNGDEDDGEFDCDFVYTNCAHNICEHQQIVMIHGSFSFNINLIFDHVIGAYYQGVPLYTDGRDCKMLGGLCVMQDDCAPGHQTFMKGLCPDKDIGVECCYRGIESATNSENSLQ